MFSDEEVIYYFKKNDHLECLHKPMDQTIVKRFLCNLTVEFRPPNVKFIFFITRKNAFHGRNEKRLMLKRNKLHWGEQKEKEKIQIKMSMLPGLATTRVKTSLSSTVQ